MGKTAEMILGIIGRIFGNERITFGFPIDVIKLGGGK